MVTYYFGHISCNPCLFLFKMGSKCVQFYTVNRLQPVQTNLVACSCMRFFISKKPKLQLTVWLYCGLVQSSFSLFQLHEPDLKTLVAALGIKKIPVQTGSNQTNVLLVNTLCLHLFWRESGQNCMRYGRFGKIWLLWQLIFVVFWDVETCYHYKTFMVSYYTLYTIFNSWFYVQNNMKILVIESLVKSGFLPKFGQLKL